MPKRSNASTFNCKLNKKYKDALKAVTERKSTEITLDQLRERYGSHTITYYTTHLGQIAGLARLRKMYVEEEEEGESSYGSTQCCGIDELVFENIVSKVTGDTPEVRHKIAKHIKSYYNDDKRVVFTGLPVRKQGADYSQYDFKKYQTLRKILLDFGFKQTTSRPYKNTNSNNMLSVLVGQFP